DWSSDVCSSDLSIIFWHFLIANLGVQSFNQSFTIISAISRLAVIMCICGLYVFFTGLKLHSKDLTPINLMPVPRWYLLRCLPVMRLKPRIKALNLLLSFTSSTALIVRVTNWGVSHWLITG